MDPTIAYITARKNSRFEEWFLPAIQSQLVKGEEPLVIKIDRFATEPSTERYGQITVRTHPPKPSVWSGPHRLTDRDWWSTSSYRNTALCLTKTEHIAYCDDLSIPGPQWWSAACAAVHYSNTVTCGLYQKVNELVVEEGKVKSFAKSELGMDHRMRSIGARIHGKCPFRWMFGCSLVAPVELLLSVGGWPEYADGLSFEDCLMSTVLNNRGSEFRFDKRLFTYEDENAHHEGTPMVRRDKGVSPKDKSHAALDIAEKTSLFDNHYPGGTRALRDYVLAGNAFPAPTGPTHDWYDNQPIAEMDADKMP